MEWTVTSPIISHQKNYRFNPLTNKHHEIIIKYCTGKDDTGLVMFMQQLLHELSDDKEIDFSTIPAIDQLFLMLRLRSLCIGTRLEIVVDEEIDGEKTQVKHKVSLIDVQKSINKHYIQPVEIVDDSGTIKTVVHYPTEWNPDKDTDWIVSMTIDDTVINFDDITSEQQHELLNNTYREYQLEIVKTINKLKQSITDMVFVRIPNQDDPGNNDPNITLSHDHFNHIIRVLYSDTLANFTELMYVFVKVMNFSLSDAMKLTPSDTQLYYQMFVKEQNEKEKAARAAQQSQSNRPSRSVPSR